MSVLAIARQDPQIIGDRLSDPLPPGKRQRGAEPPRRDMGTLSRLSTYFGEMTPRDRFPILHVSGAVNLQRSGGLAESGVAKIDRDAAGLAANPLDGIGGDLDDVAQYAAQPPARDEQQEKPVPVPVFS